MGAGVNTNYLGLKSRIPLTPWLDTVCLPLGAALCAVCTTS